MNKISEKNISIQKKLLFAGIAAILMILCVVFLWKPSSSSSYLILEGEASHVKKTSSSTYMIGVSSMSATIHPYAQDNQTTDILRQLVYQPLLMIREDQSISYMLAESVRISKQGTQINIILKEGASFSDGEPVTAQSVKDAYEWHSDPANQSSFASYTANIRDMQVKGKTQLVMTLNREVLRLPELFTVPLMHCNADAGRETLAGSGSYKISELTPLSDMTLVPVTKQGNPYDKIYISVMNYGKFDDIIKKQSADMFMIGKEGYLEKLKNNKAYDVYAMQEQEGMFLVFQDSGKLKDASLRRSLASLIQPAQAVSSLKSNEILSASGITGARKKGTLYRDALSDEKTSLKDLCLQHLPSTHSRAIAEQLQKQLQEKGIKVTLQEYNAEASKTADAYLFTGTYSDYLKTKDMSPFYRSLQDNMDISEYDDCLETYLGEQAWLLPVYRETIWTAVIHGYDTLSVFE